MKFFCEQCNSKYSIKDSRVAGRSLKVRCKKCGNIIELHGPPKQTASVADLMKETSEPTKKAAEKKVAEQKKTGQSIQPSKPSRSTRSTASSARSAAPIVGKETASAASTSLDIESSSSSTAASTDSSSMDMETELGSENSLSQVARTEASLESGSTKTSVESSSEMEANKPEQSTSSQKSAGDKQATEQSQSEPLTAAGDSLEDKFAASFRKDSKNPVEKGTAGLFDAVKESAETIDKKESEMMVWFTAIDGSPKGPISAKQIYRYQEEKKVSDDSLVWTEGMPDWVSLRSCKKLVGILAHIDIEKSLAAQDLAAEPYQSEAKPQLGLFNAPATDADDEANLLLGSGVGVVSEKAGSLGAAEGKELAELITLPAPAPTDKDKTDDADETESSAALDAADNWAAGINEESKVEQLHSIFPPSPARADRTLKLAAIGFFSIAVVAFSVILLFGQHTGEMETVTEIQERVIEKIVYRDRLPEDTIVHEEPKDTSVEGADGQDDSASNRKSGKIRSKARAKGPKKDDSSDDRKSRLLRQMGMTSGGSDSMNLIGGKNTNTSKAQVSKGDTLSSTQLSRVVNKNKSRLQTCYEQSLKRGDVPADRDLKVIVNVNVGGSGIVRNAKLRGSGTRYDNLSNCLKKSVKRWVFPASAGDSNVEFPLLFTPK